MAHKAFLKNSVWAIFELKNSVWAIFENFRVTWYNEIFLEVRRNPYVSTRTHFILICTIFTSEQSSYL